MRIFISYRRDDTRDLAGRVADRLRAHPQLGDIFLDVTSIEPGAAFLAEIQRALGRDPICLVMIGPAWAGRRADNSSRIGEPHDFVRAEVEAAFAAKLRVIPVLAGNIAMPAADDLPESLRPLASLNAVALRHETFEQDMDRLLDAILRRQRDGVLRRLRNDRPGLAMVVYSTVGMAGAAIVLLALAILHGAVFSRPLEQTLGGRGPVWMLIVATLAFGAAAGYLRGRRPI
ncbi:MAG TPA: toll/interleukin-1 receptor domain-containing protein [Reyranella sp.]|nr:toll/interleukin-1 receptor domain-containing protein [Reyranella sp.]